MSLKRLITALFKKSEIKANSSEEMELKSMLFQWIDKLEKYAQPPKEITSLNFGLFESNDGFMIYLTGSKVYDISDDDWASQIDYEPQSKYKYLLLKNAEISNLKWDEVLQTVHGHLKEFVNDQPYYSLFKKRIVATGFDDGDLIIIKRISAP